MPKSINKVIILVNIGFSAGTKFKGFFYASRKGFRELISDFIILDPYLLGLVVSVKGFYYIVLSANTEALGDGPILIEKKIFSKSI